MLLGLIAFGGAWAVTGNVLMGTVLAVSVVAVCAWSTAVGALIPITARVLGADPTVASAPFITTFVDATGLLIYFGIARIVLGV